MSFGFPGLGLWIERSDESDCNIALLGSLFCLFFSVTLRMEFRVYAVARFGSGLRTAIQAKRPRGFLVSALRSHHQDCVVKLFRRGVLTGHSGLQDFRV